MVKCIKYEISHVISSVTCAARPAASLPGGGEGCTPTRDVLPTSLILALPKKEGDNRVLPPLPPLQVPVLVI